MGRAGRSLATVLLVVAAFPAAAASGPAPAAAPAPALGAPAAVLVEAGSGEVLLERNADDRRATASTTKLMTALLVLERADPGQLVPAARYTATPIETRIDLRPGERVSVGDLLVAMLLESANDAAFTLAVRVAGSESRFVDEMNRRAAELGLRDTHFTNPIGLDDSLHYSSARDLATLARRLMRNRRFARIVDRPAARLRTGRRRRRVENTNLLVRRHPFVDGIKTGRTRRAGYVLVASGSARRVRVISVVLGEPSESARLGDSLALLDYGLDQYRRPRVLRAGQVLARAAVKYRDGERVALASPGDVAVTIRRGRRVERQVDAPQEVEGPLPAGHQVGSVNLVYRGRVVRRAPLVTAEAVAGAGLPRRLASALGIGVSGLVALLLAAAVIIVLLAVRGARRRRTRATIGTRG